MNVAVYLRVSTIDQHPENQRLQLEERVKREGWTATYFEEKESTRNTRPVKEELKRRLLQKEFDGLLVWKLDRWGRSMSELALELEAFKEAGVRFISHQEAFDYGTTTGAFMANILACFAQMERDIIRERTLAGLARARAAGRIGGRHPKACRCDKCLLRLGRMAQTPLNTKATQPTGGVCPAVDPHPTQTDVCGQNERGDCHEG